MTGARGVTEPPGARSVRRGRGWWSGGGAVLVGLCVLGLWAMFALQARADRARELACRQTDFPSTVHWEHGYPAALPIAVLTVALLGVVVSIVVLAARGAAVWSRLLSALTLAVGCLALPLAGIMTHDFYAFPGGDISTVSSSPCGSG
ncbi:MAG: hypothetical protein ACRDOO_28710 [Actinomadura sp.]